MRDFIDRMPEGYVEVSAAKVLEFCEGKLQRLKESEESAHEEAIRAIMYRHRTYFWRPWRAKPALDRHEAEGIYAEPRDYWPSERAMTETHYERARDKVRQMAAAAGIAGHAGTLYVSARTLTWLIGVGKGNA